MSTAAEKFWAIIHELQRISQPLNADQYEIIFFGIGCTNEDGNQIFYKLQEEEVAQANLSRETGPLAL